MPKKSVLHSADLRQKIIAQGVKNLHEFGYPAANEQNILTDYIYATFFKSMLKDNLGSGATVDAVLNVLLKEVENAKLEV